MINSTLINSFILLGAIQGFALCLYFGVTKAKENRKALIGFVLFLFSLSFFNMMYAFLHMHIKVLAGIPLGSFPFPYKYLIGVGVYFFIRSQLDQEKPRALIRIYWPFIPALLYACLRLYWYINIHVEKDDTLFLRIYQTGFFVYNEFVYLAFNLLLIFSSIQFLKKYQLRIKGIHKARKNWNWLVRFTRVFLVFTLVNLLHQIIVNATGFQYDAQLYLILLVINTIYIYWVGLESLHKSQFLFNTFSLQQERKEEPSSHKFSKELEHYMKTEEIFTNQNLKVVELANLLKVSEKELSEYIHDHFGLSFSDYINQHRVEKVKELLHIEGQKKYTLVAIAEQAGFSSKSSFNAVFKKITGVTPSQYKAKLTN